MEGLYSTLRPATVSTKRSSAMRTGLLRFFFSMKARRLMSPDMANCATMKESVPKALATLCSAYAPSPSMAAPTMTTLATPMTMPSRVRKLRSL